MRRLFFDNVWGIGFNEDGLHFVTLEDGFKQWVRYLCPQRGRKLRKYGGEIIRVGYQARLR